jgi:hypothetical protein
MCFQAMVKKRFFCLSTRAVDKSVHGSLPKPAQSAWLRACARLGETLTSRKYMYEISKLQKKNCGKCSDSQNCLEFLGAQLRVVHNRSGMVPCIIDIRTASTRRLVVR